MGAMLVAFGARIEVPAMRTAGRSFTQLIPVLLAVLALVAACSPSSGALGTPSTPTPTGNASVVPPSGDATPWASGQPSPAPSSVDAPTAAASSIAPAVSGTVIVRAYFVLGATAGQGGGLAPVLREIPATVAVATAAMRQLLAGPSPSELGARPAMSTAIPAATRLLGLAIKNGVAAVDLSSEFTAGLDPARPDARLAQVVYTLTQFSTVDAVALELDGTPYTGAAPGTRAGYTGFLPGIFVDRPAWGAAAGNPAAVSGLANVFEATFRIQLRDAAGIVLVDRQAMASCGTGCWGDFSTSLGYTVAKAQWGTLRVFDLSPKDGTPENVTDYPVWLTPAG